MGFVMSTGTRRVFGLGSKLTRYALFGRSVFRIQCCSYDMIQVNVKGAFRTPSRNFGVSCITLECRYCGRTIQLTVVNGNPSVEEQECAMAAEPHTGRVAKKDQMRGI